MWNISMTTYTIRQYVQFVTQNIADAGLRSQVCMAAQKDESSAICFFVLVPQGLFFHNITWHALNKNMVSIFLKGKLCDPRSFLLKGLEPNFLRVLMCLKTICLCLKDYIIFIIFCINFLTVIIQLLDHQIRYYQFIRLV